MQDFIIEYIDLVQLDHPKNGKKYLPAVFSIQNMYNEYLDANNIDENNNNNVNNNQEDSEYYDNNID